MGKRIAPGAGQFIGDLFPPECSWRPPNVGELPSWRGAKRVAFDVETHDPDLKKMGGGFFRDGYVTGYAFAIEGGPKHYLPVKHLGGDNLDNEQVRRYLHDNLKNYDGDIVGARLDYDLGYLLAEGFEFKNVRRFLDVQIADPLLYELHMSYSLDNIGQRHGVVGKYEDILKEAAAVFNVDPKGGMWKLPARYVGDYAENDVASPLELMRVMEPKMEEAELQDVWALECDVLPILVHMRHRGVRIDEDRLHTIERWALMQEATAATEIKRQTGVPFELGSSSNTDICARALHADGVQLKKTPKGQWNVDAAVFKHSDSRAAKLIGHCRKMATVRNTFCKSIRRYLVNGRIHCTFNQIARETEDGDQKGVRYGRLSCTDPNLQQQPARDPWSNLWRSIYIPEEECLWAAPDYCFSSDTEILTDRGFVKFPLLEKKDLVAQVHPDSGLVEFEKPVDYQVAMYGGEMIHISGSRSVDIMVTPNHWCLLYSESRKNSEFVRAEDVQSRTYRRMRVAGLSEGEYVPLEDMITSIAVQADGTKRNDLVYRVKLKKSEKQQRFREIVKYRNEVVIDEEWSYFNVEASDCSLLIGDFDKTFDRKKLMSLNSLSKRAFIEELLRWDGTGCLGRGSKYTTTNRVNADIVQEVAVTCGVRAILHEWWGKNSTKPVYDVKFSLQSVVSTSKFTYDRVFYRDHIFCVTMPLSTVVVRRNGKVTVAGQSQQEPRWTTHFAAVMRLPKAEEAAAAYRENPDLDNHDFMAQLTGLPRKQAKNVYLGLCYGEGGAKLCRDLGLPTRWALMIRKEGFSKVVHFETQAELLAFKMEHDGGIRQWECAGAEGQEIIDKFDERAPFIRQLAQKASGVADRRGYVKSVAGRRLHFPRRDNGSFDWTHKALNRVIQGSSADQMKKAMRALHDAGLFLQLQIHDETALSVANTDEARLAAQIMREIIPNTLVPFKVDAEVGRSWGELTTVDQWDAGERVESTIQNINWKGYDVVL